MALSLVGSSSISLNAKPLMTPRCAAPLMQQPTVKSWYDAGVRLSTSKVAETMVGKVVPTGAVAKPASEPSAAPAAPREIAWFPKNAKELAPPVFEWRPMFKAFGCKPGDAAPAHLTGVFAGDNGFDPLCLAATAKPAALGADMLNLASKGTRLAKLAAMSDEEKAANVAWMREAEVKHARLAMLAAAGWIHAELFSPLELASHGRAPSLFNGGLFELPTFLGLAVWMGGLAYVELNNKVAGADLGKGDLGFDPAGWKDGLALGPITKTPQQLAESEIANGRLAMMAITGYAVQEFFWGAPIAKSWGIFFPHVLGN